MLQAGFVEFLARQTKFVQRKSSLNGARFANLMVFSAGCLSETSLCEQCEDFEYRYGEKLKKQSLHDRFNQYAVAFLRALLEDAIARKIDPKTYKDFLPNQKSVKIKDSTSFQLPDDFKDLYPGSGGISSKACLKIQFEYDLKTGKVTEMSIGGFTTTDLTNSYQTKDQIEAGDLLIRDLGYVSLEYMEIVKEQEAFYLNRIKSNISLWVKTKEGLFEPLNLARIEKQMRKGNKPTRQVSVYLGAKKNVECRLIIQCLPEEVSAKRLRKAHQAAKREGRILGKDTIARIGLNLFVTNMSDEDLPMEHVWPLYRLRWQIELVFKAFKTVAQIDKIKKVKLYRLECYLYGKLLWALLGWDIYWKLTKGNLKLDKIISINKLMKNFRRLCLHLTGYGKKTKQECRALIIAFVENVFDHCLLEKRKQKTSSLEIISEICKINLI